MTIDDHVVSKIEKGIEQVLKENEFAKNFWEKKNQQCLEKTMKYRKRKNINTANITNNHLSFGGAFKKELANAK